MSSTTNLSSLVINYLTEAQYQAAKTGGTLNENQLYFTPAEATPAILYGTSAPSSSDGKDGDIFCVYEP